jgi:hypothetical protein
MTVLFLLGGSRQRPNLSLNPDASPAALTRRPLGAGYLGWLAKNQLSFDGDLGIALVVVVAGIPLGFAFAREIVWPYTIGEPFGFLALVITCVVVAFIGARVAPRIPGREFVLRSKIHEGIAGGIMGLLIAAVGSLAGF